MPDPRLYLVAAWTIASATACAGAPDRVLTFSGSVVGREADVIRRQLDRFREEPVDQVAVRPRPMRRTSAISSTCSGSTPAPAIPTSCSSTSCGRRSSRRPAGLPLDRFNPPVDDFFPAAVAAESLERRALRAAVVRGRRHAVLAHRPRAAAAARPRRLALLARRAQDDTRQIPFGFVWQGARYEGLVTVFLEYLGAFGGAILDDEGRVVVDSEPAVQALTSMRDAIYVERVVPRAVLTWQEEQTRFAFQNGEAVVHAQLALRVRAAAGASQSSVAGRFAVTRCPAGPGGAPTAALGGSALAINAYSDQPEAAYQLIDYLLQPEQMIERARIAGQYPTRPALYETRELADALTMPPADALADHRARGAAAGHAGLQPSSRKCCRCAAPCADAAAGTARRAAGRSAPRCARCWRE